MLPQETETTLTGQATGVPSRTRDPADHAGLSLPPPPSKPDTLLPTELNPSMNSLLNRNSSTVTHNPTDVTEDGWTTPSNTCKTKPSVTKTNMHTLPETDPAKFPNAPVDHSTKPTLTSQPRTKMPSSRNSLTDQSPSLLMPPPGLSTPVVS